MASGGWSHPFRAIPEVFLPGFLIVPALLRLISEGRLFKQVFAWLLRLWTVAAMVEGVWVSIELWRGGGTGSQAVFGQLIFQVGPGVAVYLVAHLGWVRAQDVAAMPQIGGEVIIPLTRLLLRLGGELYASLMVVLGVGGAVMIWISAGEARVEQAELRVVLPGVGGDPFPAGLNMLLTGLGCGALSLLGGYLASELLGLLCAIESNTGAGSWGEPLSVMGCHGLQRGGHVRPQRLGLQHLGLGAELEDVAGGAVQIRGHEAQQHGAALFFADFDAGQGGGRPAGLGASWSRPRAPSPGTGPQG